MATIIYGTLYPFQFVWPNLEQIEWLDWGTQVSQRTTNGDRLSNLLTFIPIGFIGLLLCPRPAKKYNSQIVILTRALWVLLAACSFAYLLQIVQFFTPRRVPTAADVLYNCWGVIVGLLVAIWLEYFLSKKGNGGKYWFSQYAIPAFLVSVWGLVQLFPFFLATDLVTLENHLVQLIDLERFSFSQFFIQSIFWFTFYRLLQDYFLVRKSAIVLGLVGVGFIILKILIPHVDISFTWLLGMMAGLLFGIVLTRKFEKVELAKINILLLLFALIIMEFYPFHTKMFISSFNWLPLGSFLNGSLWVNTQLVLKLFFVYGSLLFWLNLIFPEKIKNILILVVIVLIQEISQLVFSFGQADITNPLLVGMLGFAFLKFEKVELKHLKS
ncbi:VanZ family protein [Aliikangiella sp. G2MR2-5]|uniref:VanZ family protein n=1 Tax=Aliikangiella sp. G2MR2-5 TaxID=2788943 RepID=UPI0018ABF876|nr:VanZ family protein [Aliikangiella sp. G2MR2-5]